MVSLDPNHAFCTGDIMVVSGAGDDVDDNKNGQVITRF